MTLILFPIHSVYAGDAQKSAVYFYGCDEYENGEEFVRESIRKCSKTRYERSCLKKARDLYNYCSYDGSFKKTYSKLHSDALVVLVLAGLKAGE